MRRGHKYLTVVVDHDSGVLLWAHPGRDHKTLEKFFDSLGAQRCAQITLVSADAAEWIATVGATRCQNAELLRLLTRIAFGFRSPDALVALAMLDLGGMCPPLPGRDHLIMPTDPAQEPQMAPR